MVTFSISSHESSKGSMNTTICNDHIGLVIVVSGALSMCICMVFMYLSGRSILQLAA